MNRSSFSNEMKIDSESRMKAKVVVMSLPFLSFPMKGRVVNDGIKGINLMERLSEIM